MRSWRWNEMPEIDSHRAPTAKAYRHQDDDGTVHFNYALYLWDEGRWVSLLNKYQALELLESKGLTCKQANNKLSAARNELKRSLLR